MAGDGQHPHAASGEPGRSGDADPGGAEAARGAGRAHGGRPTAKSSCLQTTTVNINPPGYWVEHGKPNAQASLVVDPPNGRIPASDSGRPGLRQEPARTGSGRAAISRRRSIRWEDFDFYSRCITRGLVSSMLPTLYNFGNEIVQAPGVVVIRNEMIHETRVIPLDGRPQWGKGLRDLHGRFTRPLGRRHARGRDHQSEQQNRHRRRLLQRRRGPDRKASAASPRTN